MGFQLPKKTPNWKQYVVSFYIEPEGLLQKDQKRTLKGSESSYSVYAYKKKMFFKA